MGIGSPTLLRNLLDNVIKSRRHFSVFLWLDLTKAVATMDHSLLFKTFTSLGFNEVTPCWSSCFFSGLSVCWRGWSSSTKLLDSGVPQSLALDHLPFPLSLKSLIHAYASDMYMTMAHTFLLHPRPLPMAYLTPPRGCSRAPQTKHFQIKLLSVQNKPHPCWWSTPYLSELHHHSSRDTGLKLVSYSWHPSLLPLTEASSIIPSCWVPSYISLPPFHASPFAATTSYQPCSPQLLAPPVHSPHPYNLREYHIYILFNPQNNPRR